MYKGHVELVDLEVVVSTPATEDTPQRGFELLSPHQSFAVYAGELRSSYMPTSDAYI